MPHKDTKKKKDDDLSNSEGAPGTCDHKADDIVPQYFRKRAEILGK